MRRNLDKNRLRPSEPLSYKFGPPLENYDIDRFMNPKSRLFIDATEYMQKRRDLIPQDVLDASQTFSDFLKSNNAWKATYLYDVNWEELGLEKYISLNIDLLVEDRREEVSDRYEAIQHSLYIEVSNYKANYADLISSGLLGKLSPKYSNIQSILNFLENKGTSDLKSVIAAIYISVEKFDDAIRIYIGKEPKEPYDLYNLGTIHLLEKKNELQKKDKLSAVKDYFNKAIELQGLPEAHYNLGMTYIIRA